jgi:DNA-binding transcriptional ArsR family regulator
MPSSKSDLILHPGRLRILRALIGQTLTAQEIAGQLEGVPTATLYRHLNKLVEAGMLEVVEERPIRGTVERVYTLRAGAGRLSPEEVAQITPEDQLRYFTVFVTQLLDDFTRYVRREDADLVQDGVGYRQCALNLTDEEYQVLIAGMDALLIPLMQNSPGSGRRRRVLTTISLIEKDKDS